MEKSEEDRIRAAVSKALEGADLNLMSEARVRQLASKETGIDLSQRPYKMLVQKFVEEFLEAIEGEEEEASDDKKKSEETGNANGGCEEDTHQQKKSKTSSEPVFTHKGTSPGGGRAGESRKMEDGSLVVCQLTSRRNITVCDWKGTKLVSIREFYEKNGKSLPGKGISLNRDQWSALKEGFSKIDTVIQTLKNDN